MVSGCESFNGHAPTIFNMIHCDGNANDLSASLGKGLCIVDARNGVLSDAPNAGMGLFF